MEFLALNQLPTEGMVFWDDFCTYIDKQFDFILFDIGWKYDRSIYLSEILKNIKKKTIVMFTDMQDSIVRVSVNKILDGYFKSYDWTEVCREVNPHQSIVCCATNFRR